MKQLKLLLKQLNLKLKQVNKAKLFFSKTMIFLFFENLSKIVDSKKYIKTNFNF